MGVKTGSRLSSRKDRGAGSASSAEGASPRNQLFLSFFLARHAKRRALPFASLAIVAGAAFGAATLVFLAGLIAFETFAVTRAVAAAIAGAGAFAAAHRKLAADHAERRAALALSGGLLDANRECLKLLDTDARMLRITEFGADLMNAASPDQLAGADWLGFWSGADRTAADAAWSGALAGERTTFTGQCATATGRPKWWDSRLIPLADDEGRITAMLCASTDVSEQNELLEKLRSKDQLMSEMEAHVQLVFYSYSADFEYFHYVSAGIEAVFGIAPCVLMQRPSAWLDLVLPEDAEPLLAEMRRVVEESSEGRFQYRIRRTDGCVRWIRSTAYPVRDETGVVVRIVGISEDVTAEQERITALDRLAYSDSLTGLANRGALVRQIEARCAKAAPFGLMFIDLDRFKVLNDTLGHTAADRLLKDIGRVIQAALPPDAYVARLGGDEFAVLAGSTADKAQLASLAQTLLDVLSSSGRNDHAGAFVTASIGISLYPEHGLDHEALLTSADIAMYAAKKAGRNGFRFADKDATGTIEDFELERGLPMALASGEFLLHYQGIHEPGALSMTSVEALIRWMHPSRGLIAPAVFIPILEESGFIVDVGAWVVDRALGQLAEWRKNGASELCMSVNVSARQLRGDAIVNVVDRALRKHGLSPRSLEIELTESALLENPELAQQTLTALKQLGVRIAIDDFGTGYSSLRYLADILPDTVKIDRSFTAKLALDAATRTIVRGIIDMSHDLGIMVTAEGVEEEQQLDILRAAQCDFVQGYHLSRPVAPLVLDFGGVEQASAA
ncbi:response regulator receiver modulated diguanylate cyclase/phosphodiesterase [Caballeronia telluris]|uniref:Response regulator receiver modulated diguanylate cyclase/phosphodiesterase n=1 Tax=Caballeronia telluris TaxID=326475 RepID=A0A158GAK6_9BURK|nr:response regulator receiver modulated diguanylate cyclase/phosphodiesterase [Caballeronia telluris]